MDSTPWPNHLFLVSISHLFPPPFLLCGDFCSLYSLQSFPGSSAGKESACNSGDPGLVPGFGKICWRRARLPTPVFLDFPGGSADKESACNAGDLGSVPGLERSPGEGLGYPLQHSGLENSIGCIVHGVAKSWT